MESIAIDDQMNASQKKEIIRKQFDNRLFNNILIILHI